MENQTEKKLKTKPAIRNAVKKYTNGLKIKNPEKYNMLVDYHRAYNREYYKKLKEDRQKLKLLEQKNINN
jgi:hypothetical protein